MPMWKRTDSEQAGPLSGAAFLFGTKHGFHPFNMQKAPAVREQKEKEPVK